MILIEQTNGTEDLEGFGEIDVVESSRILTKDDGVEDDVFEVVDRDRYADPTKRFLDYFYKGFRERGEIDPAAEKELVWRVHSGESGVVGDRDAMLELAVAHGPFVIGRAKKKKQVGVPLDDLLQEGFLGLIQGVLDDDPEVDRRLLTHAEFSIRKSLYVAAATNNSQRLMSTKTHVFEMATMARRLARRIFAQEGREPDERELYDILLDQGKLTSKTIGARGQLVDTHTKFDTFVSALKAHRGKSIIDNPAFFYAGGLLTADTFIIDTGISIPDSAIKYAALQALDLALSNVEGNLAEEQEEVLSRRLGLNGYSIHSIEEIVGARGSDSSAEDVERILGEGLARLGYKFERLPEHLTYSAVDLVELNPAQLETIQNWLGLYGSDSEDIAVMSRRLGVTETALNTRIVGGLEKLGYRRADVVRLRKDCSSKNEHAEEVVIHRLGLLGEEPKDIPTIGAEFDGIDSGRVRYLYRVGLTNLGLSYTRADIAMHDEEFRQKAEQEILESRKSRERARKSFADLKFDIERKIETTDQTRERNERLRQELLGFRSEVKIIFNTRLTGREKSVLSSTYSLGDSSYATQKEMARIYGIAEARIGQVLQDARAKVRSYMNLVGVNEREIAGLFDS